MTSCSTDTALPSIYPLHAVMLRHLAENGQHVHASLCIQLCCIDRWAQNVRDTLVRQIIYLCAAAADHLPRGPQDQILGPGLLRDQCEHRCSCEAHLVLGASFLLDFISPIAFSDVAIGYHADKYTILAHPDVSHSPLLAKVLEVSRA